MLYMNRKQRITFSVVGITIVLLALLGLTYAYFLTRIQGNTNEKSISVTTANLVLEYGENTNVVHGISNAEPGYSVEKIFTATNIGDSTVTYGAALEDIVNELTRQEDLEYTLTCTSYLKEGFSLASDGTITGTVDGMCNGVDTGKQFPSTSTMSLMTTNTIDTTHTQVYKLTVTYKEMNVDQSDDMNKTYNAKVNIIDINSLIMNNPYKNDINTLKKAIIDNSMLKLNGTEYREIPKTQPAKEVSSFVFLKENNPAFLSKTLTLNNATDYYISYADDYIVDETTGKFTLVNPTVVTTKYTIAMANSLVGKYAVWSTNVPTIANTKTQYNIYKISTNISEINSTIKYSEVKTVLKSTEKELSIANDDYGTSYYFRGGVEDNFVNFAGMCWRIVRIEGDGSTKLILEDKNVECDNSSYTGEWINENTQKLEEDMLNSGFDFIIYKFQEKYLTSYIDKLKVDEWCYDYVEEPSEDSVIYSNAYTRIVTDKNPTFKCQGRKLSYYLNADDDMYVGILTADEVAYTGLISERHSGQYSTSYLFNNYSSFPWFTFSAFATVPIDNSYIEDLFTVDNRSGLSAQEYDYFRPSITLLSSVKISKGDGTQSNPYIVK